MMLILEVDSSRWPTCQVCKKRVDDFRCILDLFKGPSGTGVGVYIALCHGQTDSQAYHSSYRPSQFGVAFGENSFLLPEDSVLDF